MPTLFPHQEAGVEWLCTHPRGGLFDDQGLGKTAQVIVACDRVQALRVLVVAPSVVAHNWKREFGLWSPKRRVQVIATGADKLDPHASVCVVSHTLLLRTAIMRQLFAEDWDVAVLDEAHFFRNPKAQRTKRFFSLREGVDSVSTCAERVWCLTGTPVPNNPSELWSMLRGLAPERIKVAGRILTWLQFRERFCVLATSPYGDGWKVVAAKNMIELRERLKGFSLRRMKTQVLDLPPIRYGTVLLDGNDTPQELSQLEAQMQGKVADSDEGTLAALRETVEFSTWRRLCGEAKVAPAVALLDDELSGTTHKVVIFCHHTDVAVALRSGLHHHGSISILGSVPAKQRQDLVDQFQRDARTRVAICQIVAGGTGITLTAAADVVLVEQSFVPGENLQAIDRVYRIGQTRPVLVRALALAGSVDELLTEILARKTQMIREVLS